MKTKVGKRLDGTPVTLKPHEVIEVDKLPNCDFCGDGTKAEYDFATSLGPWANGCEKHFKQYQISPSLGLGKGQMLIERATVSQQLSAS